MILETMGTDPSHVDVAALAETAVQGRVIGFIRPPPDIRILVDKTAQFIAKSGDEMESRILSQRGGDPKFAFLKPDNPYYSYFRHKVEEIRKGDAQSAVPQPSASERTETEEMKPKEEVKDVEAKLEAKEIPVEAESKEEKVERKVATIPNTLAKALRSIDREKAPPKDEFAVVCPLYATQKDIEVIKLTAQFTATGGQAFLSQLTSNESKNPTFAFLKPSHALFGYFTMLVDAYKRVLNPSESTKDFLEKALVDRYPILERAIWRFEHQQYLEEKREKANDEWEAEKAAFASVDWHDFVVVETITFDDDNVDLPAPRDLSAAVASKAVSSLKRQKTEPAPVALVPTVEDDDMEMDEDVPIARVPSIPDHDEGEKLIIRTDYKPGQQAPITTGPTHFIDPRTGKSVPISSATEHLRIELLDPKWKEQTERAVAKQAGSILAPEDEITENLKRFASRRSDIFGDDVKPLDAKNEKKVVGVTMPDQK